MAWEDRTPFDAIEAQFNLSHDQIVSLMRQNLKRKSFNLWRKRVRGRKTKHSELRSFKVGRHLSYLNKWVINSDKGIFTPISFPHEHIPETALNVPR